MNYLKSVSITCGCTDQSLDEDCTRKLEVEQGDFMSALDSLTPSISSQDLEKYKNINTKMS